eukprot:CAMPEP_0198147182 /NCGR_PEP_ID=MMETSP1443-20131203/33596_1 /TAXON_ID=186043 /ORGANISM="Entomoneis sp., Strain CCMP2396" /LENGTH=409 /DNA_ID=CAMNT_0043811371 /DNA_START=24 /DNA_END=1249 /DNA_ORIENTATION=+
MDLLASLNIDELPEQQTRMMEIMERHPELNVRLGFDACCNCGTELSSPTSIIACPFCQRVDYCSEGCREQDSKVLSTMSLVEASSPEEPTETATGHSSIICALLKLCQDDDDVEAKEATHLDAQRREASQDRIQSELESYPATLANVIATGPFCQSVLRDCQRSSEKKLTIHVIGATAEAELWGNDEDLDAISRSYAEAFADLADQRNLSLIEILFVGLDCPISNLQQSRPIGKTNQSANGQLVMRTYRGAYSTELLAEHNVANANVVVFFNPGFTVPEYNWVESLDYIPKGTPFLSATNTEMEGVADCQFLLDQDRIQSIPPGLADMFGLYSHADDGDDDAMAMRETSFFTVNPFCGNRVRQSGTMANDLFVKNRWMLGGIMDRFDPTVAQQSMEAPKKRRTAEGGNT